MPQESQSLLMKTIDRLEATVNSLSSIANNITYEIQSTNFKLARQESRLSELEAEEENIDERAKNSEEKINTLDRTLLINTGKLERIVSEIAEIKEAAKSLNAHLKSDYVSKEQFSPIQKIVYTVAGFILTAVVGAIVNLVIHK